MIIKFYRLKKIQIILLLIFIFFINVSIEYSRFLDFKDEDIFEVKAEILNIYPKENFDILKFKTNDFEFFSKLNKNEGLKRLDFISCAIDTRNIDFISYLEGFFTNIIYFETLEKNIGFKEKIIKNVENNHTNEQIIELFNTLFLAIPVSQNLRDIFINYGISHVVALSGFHLVVISFVIYWILYFPYSFFQTKYFPYRNRRFDILLFTIVVLFYYLILTDVVPSLLRAFVLFCLGIVLLRSNIKIISYMTLLYTFLIVIAIYPKYIFSIGFWFSTIAVFYIYLFLQYFKNLNKLVAILFFNFWMFLIFNPIVHLFFYQTTIEQFYSIPITMFFTIFYPFEIFAHIFNFSNYFDKYIEIFLSYKFYVYEVKTPVWFIIFYLICSFSSIFSNKAFSILNILMLGFNTYMYLSF
ncbi:ComEC/Rec2 family competence protein [Aliarcobacter cibarius]|uniref:ComEC/Rec2 family competence protein n=1 Tax=Aliarcobacter cibarius TaxID=255507 RepID=A0A7L5JQ64_9BACT|nr:ComEC/Rec2 family competence protein [Aliarcobacter cibarius]QKJ27279.1 competence protein, ComEC family [Aliarcobacter cibarius]TLT01504.1 ComEC/Rec2 family competence protein [Aliarcobacter cibarius]TLT01995.1 ComEC/Rec2 family competence protein [Aliarcobacter cibarius]TLT04163.1 ComEC/Rec2 family competence protein [Aliarcobacter cibarius]